MRLMPALVVIATSVVPACGSSRSEKTPSATAAPVEAGLTFEVLRADTRRTTTEGTSFIAAKDWKIAVRGAATLLEPPEAGSRIALVDVDAKDADAAVEAAWAAYGAPGRKLK